MGKPTCRPLPPSGLTAEAPQGAAWEAAIEGYLRTQMERGHIPGLSVAVLQRGELLFARGYGLENVEVSAPANANTVYRLGSVTKPFTATAVMMLAEEGKLSLDDRIAHYLLGLPVAWDDVTIRHLLNHTSGIKSYTCVPEFARRAVQDSAHEEVIDLVTGYPLAFEPGERWEYSNTGYFLLGMILEWVADKPYAALLHERIFAPLGMAATGVYDTHAITANRADGYEWDGEALANVDEMSPTWPFATGALASTVLDLARWDAALFTERLLRRETLDQMWTPARLADGSTAPYGFGWFLDEIRGHRRIHHTGGIRGFLAQFTRFPDDHATVILLCNLGTGDITALADGVVGRAVPELADLAEHTQP